MVSMLWRKSIPLIFNNLTTSALKSVRYIGKTPVCILQSKSNLCQASDNLGNLAHLRQSIRRTLLQRSWDQCTDRFNK